MTKEQKLYLEQFWQDISATGEKLRSQPMPELREEDFFLFKQNGNRLIYEGEYFGRRKYLTVFGILSEFGGKKEDIEELGRVMEAICTERFWALPAHVDFDALNEKTIDLFAAETAQSLMEIIDIMGERLPMQTMESVVREVTERVILPFVTSQVPYSWWEKDRCNWSAVCAGAVGMAAIYLAHWYERTGHQEDNRLPQNWKQLIIDRVCDALQCYLDGMEEDGACTEGLGYFSYGMSYYAGFAQLLEQETNGRVNLMNRPKCTLIALFQQKCYFGGGVSVSFSDGSSRECFLPGLTAYLKACYPQVVTPDYSLARPFDGDACYRWLSNERNIRWVRQYDTEQREGTDTGEWHYDLLPCAQWLMCKDPQGNGYAAKGGHNDENHNHNDVGHFLCIYEGELLLTDLGAGEYTREYFSDGRYDILCNRSLGHSVPIINGMEQCQGREYAADSFTFDEQTQTLMISFAGAYPQGCIEGLYRSMQVQDQKKALQLTVSDEFVLSGQTHSIRENLVTQYPPRVNGNKVSIRGAHSIMNIEIEGMTGEASVLEKQHSNHKGEPETVYLIQWNVPLHEKKVQCQMRIVCDKIADNT